MSDFLYNLIARSFAGESAVQPRLPSMFEPIRVETFSDSEVAAGPSSTSKAETSVAPTVPSQPSKQFHLSMPDPPNIHVPFVSTSQANEIVNAPEDKVGLEPPDLADPNASPVAWPSPPERATRVGSPEIRPMRSSPPADHFSGTGQAPRRQRTSPSPEKHPASAAPTIHVTIGRVEVRAIQPVSTAPKSVKPAPPKLSLDDYLQKREGSLR